MARDIRISFIGDSLIAGVGDPEHLGWVGRVSARAGTKGLPLTAYNLGIRRDTSVDVAARWRSEIGLRVAEGADNRVVLSFGINDIHQGLPAEASMSSLTDVLEGLAGWGLPTLMVGPTAVLDESENASIGALSAQFAAVCLRRGVPYVETVHSLAGDPVWMSQLAEGDGVHPGAEAYAQLAELVFDRWWEWVVRSTTS
ncbi:GDSL-type esterase/lipase family protein [Pseudonocardia spinosispora]|uniref:GDSL-type esterase/lipase family protein n=1 Tax=Pseudonocardia spinosispora TaxID=103441 RepID=UPI0004903371|nr:GDSL-type esterase/lipase family protein [Pseudonocardia spinosispora]